MLVAGITAALIIILSVFNGLEDLLRSLNNSFDPQLKIEASEGKSFEVSPERLDGLRKIPGVKYVTEVIEDYAYVRYRDASQVVVMKGVSANYLDQHRIDDTIIEGELSEPFDYAIVGQGIRYSLNLALEDIHALHVYYIKDIKRGSLDPSGSYVQMSIRPGAVFSIVQNFDENYIVVPLAFATELLSYDNRRTSLEIMTSPEADETQVAAAIQSYLGDGFKVLNHEQQHKDLYKLLKTEKLFAFLTLSLLLVVGSINIFFSLMMLALEKKKDVSVLFAMGTPLSTIRNIFLMEGSMIAFLGTGLGLLGGFVLVFLQDRFGLVSMGMETSVTEGYPVRLLATDFLYVLLAMVAITITISIKPSRMAARFANVQNL